jgi:hypothetical protein
MDPKKRFREHRSLLRRGLHQCKSLQALWSAMGEDKFHLKIVDTLPLDCSVKDKREAEQRMFDIYERQGLLLNDTTLSFQPSEEARKRGQARGGAATRKRLAEDTEFATERNARISASMKRYRKQQKVVHSGQKLTSQAVNST